MKIFTSEIETTVKEVREVLKSTIGNLRNLLDELYLQNLYTGIIEQHMKKIENNLTDSVEKLYDIEF